MKIVGTNIQLTANEAKCIAKYLDTLYTQDSKYNKICVEASVLSGEINSLLSHLDKENGQHTVVERVLYDIKPDDIEIFTNSYRIQKLDKKELCEELYFELEDSMRSLGWYIDVWDFGYMCYLTGELHICYKDEERFKSDMANCINEILNDL